MQRFLVRLFMLLALLAYFSFTSAAPVAETHKTETYQIDPMHTYVLWSTTHVGFSVQSGKLVMIDGTITLDEAKPQNSKVNIIIHTNDLVTGIPKLDAHLKSKDFFNVSTYPTATFVSDKIVVTGKNTGKIYGKLTLLGVTKPVTLDVKLFKAGIHPISGKKSLGFSAASKIKRSDFGMNYFVPAVGDEVKLDIGAEAALVQP